MKKGEQSNDFMIMEGVKIAINNSEFLKLLSKRVLELYKASILVNYNQKRIYNKISGSAEEYNIAIGFFSKKAIELNRFIDLFYQQIDVLDLGEIKNATFKYIETRLDKKLEISDDQIKKSLSEIINKFKIDEYYGELFQLYFDSLSDEEKDNLSDLQLSSAAEKAVLMGHFGSGYPREQMSKYQQDLTNAENGNLFTMNNFLGEIKNATVSVKNTLKNSEIYSQMDSHHRII